MHLALKVWMEKYKQKEKKINQSKYKRPKKQPKTPFLVDPTASTQ